jgi:hypothetical protein
VTSAGECPAKHYLLSDPNGNKIEVPLNISSRAGMNLTMEKYPDNHMSMSLIQ